MSRIRISKWFFKDFKENISNLYYSKQLPFLCYSDISTDYSIIGAILDRINLNKSLLVSVGKTQAPFGVTINASGDDLNKLLNSCQYCFIMTDKIEDTNYLLKTVLANIIPICNKNHIFINQLGLKDFACGNSYKEIINKLINIRQNQKIYDFKISLFSWKYNQQLKKWHKKK